MSAEWTQIVRLPDGQHVSTTSHDPGVLGMPSQGRVMYRGPSVDVPEDLAVETYWRGLLIASYVLRRPLRPEMLRWTDPAQMSVDMESAPYERNATAGGAYELVVPYNAPGDATVIAETVKTYVGGPNGPSTRAMSHRLLRDDGTWYAWSRAAKSYTEKQQLRKGRARRVARLDDLVSSLRSTVVGAGGDPSQLLALVESSGAASAFRELAVAQPIVDTLTAAGQAALAGVVAAELAPWIPA